VAVLRGSVNTDYSFHMELLQYAAWGASANGMGMFVALVCSESCTVNDTTHPEEPILIKTGEVTHGSWFLSQPAGLDVTNYAIQVPVYVAWAPVASTDVALFVDIEDLFLTRCDNMRYLASTGCVFPWATGKFFLSSHGNAPESALFVAEALGFLAGHPGRLDGTPLHRVMVGSQEYNENVAAKDTACAAMEKPPSPVTLDCDEYPFASTAEGMRTGNAAVRYLPATANRSAGGSLSGYYSSERIQFGDSFWVIVY
jgi:hypothetical protein